MRTKYATEYSYTHSKKTVADMEAYSISTPRLMAFQDKIHTFAEAKPPLSWTNAM